MIRAPIQATLYITNYCQIRCDHCFFVDRGVVNTNHMPIETVFSILEEFAREGVFMIVVSGGDPILHPDFKKIIDKMLSLRLLPLLGVTGIGLNRLIIDFLISRGIRHIQVSIDHFKKTMPGLTKERIIGEEVDCKLDLLFDAGMVATVAVCIHKANLIDIEPLVRYLLNRPIEKIKAVFWKKTEYGLRRGLEDLNSKEREFIIQKLSKLDEGRDVIVCPGYQALSTGDLHPNIEDQMRLVVLADGTISTSETGEAIGRVENGEIVTKYIQFKEKVVTSNLNKAQTMLMNAHRIKGIWKVPRRHINGSGAIITMMPECCVIIADDLNKAQAFFVLLHEIGHKVLGITRENPRNNYSREQENKINSWCIEQLGPFITTRFYNQLRDSVNDEDRIFNLIGRDLYMNFVGEINEKILTK